MLVTCIWYKDGKTLVYNDSQDKRMENMPWGEVQSDEFAMWAFVYVGF